MAYVSLYRKYRPQTFADVVGQDHVTSTLAHAVDEGRLHHAYLFTGPRGTGKTSTARILAKAVNCEQGPTSTPCNVCDICQAITTGASIDVIELDMASHGGVDDARELRDRALFAPAQARRKVYILDEVHMASTAAFNALLKLIEEPPAHVLFAMATTDPQKVIPTIMSRVQRLDLRRVAADDVAANVRGIAEHEGRTIADAAVEAVVRAGDGSVRDTQSVLEQVLAYAEGEVGLDQVAKVLGHTPAQRTFDAVEAIARRDVATLLGLVQGLLDDGHDLRRFTFDLLANLRDLLVLQVAPDHPNLVDATDERRAQLADQSTTLARETLLRAVDLLAATVTEQRQGPARLPLELALAKLAVPGTAGDLAGLADRVGRLEQQGAPAAEAHAPVIDPNASSPGMPTADAPTAAGSSLAASASDAPAPDGPTTDVPTPEPPDADAPMAAAPASDTPIGDVAPGTSSDDPPAAEVTSDEPSRADGQAPPPDDVAGSPAAGDELAQIVDRWAAGLEVVKSSSRRMHAVFEPAQPIALTRGVLTLRYPTRYASFHAQNARKSGFADELTAAVSQVCGLRVKVDAVVEGDEARRPMPPTVTPADAVLPADPDAAEVSAASGEDVDVREAELDDNGRAAADDDPRHTDELLARELGAALVDERRPGSANG